MGFIEVNEEINAMPIHISIIMNNNKHIPRYREKSMSQRIKCLGLHKTVVCLVSYFRAHVLIFCI